MYKISSKNYIQKFIGHYICNTYETVLLAVADLHNKLSAKVCWTKLEVYGETEQNLSPQNLSFYDHAQEA
jgi:hypothetical protein